MNASVLAVPNDAERLLVAETELDQLSALDKDAAIELEARIRPCNKYVSQYRRGASDRRPTIYPRCSASSSYLHGESPPPRQPVWG